ncbi:methyl-accepting chemotaxis protein [Paraburkholderia dipogonis]|uniref:methyl-accepting chemotaxis protein n=1 Tax=Paraburkholderia dipogonis TaxID=1211383 RepID=UPI0038B95BC9
MRKVFERAADKTGFNYGLYANDLSMSLKDIPLRRGLVTLLVLFGLLVLATGLAAMKALERTVAVSQSMRALDEATIDLKDTYLNNLKARSALARAYIAQSENASARDGAIAAAMGFYATAHKSFNAFVAVPKGSEDERSAAAVAERTFRAHAEVFDKLFEIVKAGDMQRYASVNEGPMTATSVEFGKASDEFFKVQAAASKVLARERDQNTARMFAITGTVAAIAIGLIALSYWALNRVLVRPLREAVLAVGEVARGNLMTQLPRPSRNEIGTLAEALQSMQANLTAIVRDVRGGSDTMVTGVRELSAGNTDLSARTEEQAAALEETASSMEQLTATVRQNTESAQQASRLATMASGTARDGGIAVQQVIDTMQSIARSSEEIKDIISVIEGIAFQTNILALNAAVEAARAGEDGRGFAVVAGEVRSLAQRSATAAKEIKQLIEDSTSRIAVGSAQVDRTGKTMTDVVQSVQQVTDLMAEIAAASGEQTAGIEQVSKAISQMDEVTQQNAALVEQAAAAAQSLESQAQALAGAVSAFKVES